MVRILLAQHHEGALGIVRHADAPRAPFAEQRADRQGEDCGAYGEDDRAIQRGVIAPVPAGKKLLVGKKRP